jgi:hypothetical protein
MYRSFRTQIAHDPRVSQTHSPPASAQVSAQFTHTSSKPLAKERSQRCPVSIPDVCCDGFDINIGAM